MGRTGQRIYNYRKYNGKSCKGGLMSYAPPRSGWSTCGQRDMSRYLTSGGKKKPCTFGSKIKQSTCKSTCNGAFKRCVTAMKNRNGKTCSAGYSICAQKVADSNSMYNLTPDCAVNCKPNKKMIALKSKSLDTTSDANTSLCDNLDYSSEMAEDKKRWLCVPRREKKYTKYKTTKKSIKMF